MKRLFLRMAAVAMVLLFLLAGVVLYRTLTFTSMQMEIAQRPLPDLPMDRAAETLRLALAVETISHQDVSKVNTEAFARLHRLIQERFPRVHDTLARETVADWSLVYTWPGKDPKADAMILLAHQDVVDAPDGDSWEHPPFGGVIADGYIWGRGAMDDKGSLFGILEAVEVLLERGFQPERTVYLCFGHDEEVGGFDGAAVIAGKMKERGIRAEFLLDEGMAVVDGAVLGLDRPIAFVAITEKGYLSLELTATGEPGHSSTPPRETTLGFLSAAVARVASNPMPASLSDPMRLMFRYLGPEMAFPMKAAFANLWLTEPLLLRVLGQGRETDAAVRTTTAVTIMEGGVKENVLPATARAVVNFRLKPGDTVEYVTERTRVLIDDDRITVAPTRTPNESTPMARVDAPAFSLMHKNIREVFGDVLVAPSMMLGGSDSHHYAGVASNIYGFSPVALSDDDLKRIHGPNERIAIEDYRRMIAFYLMLLEKAAGSGFAP